jgi:hypothetical protein
MCSMNEQRRAAADGDSMSGSKKPGRAHGQAVDRRRWDELTASDRYAGAAMSVVLALVRITVAGYRLLKPLTGPGLSSLSSVIAPSFLNTAPFFITNETVRSASMSSSGLPGTPMKSA